jgi:hypothetical protein
MSFIEKKEGGTRPEASSSGVALTPMPSIIHQPSKPKALSHVDEGPFVELFPVFPPHFLGQMGGWGRAEKPRVSRVVWAH